MRDFTPLLLLALAAAAIGCGPPEPAKPPAGSAETSAQADSPAGSPSSDEGSADGDKAPPPPGAELEATLRKTLEPAVWGGTATLDEIRLLHAICAHQGDRVCRDRANSAYAAKKAEQGAAAAAGGAPTAAPSGPASLPDPTSKGIDEAAVRRVLEAKIWSGKGSIDDMRMLKAICSHMGDRECRDRAAAEIKKTLEAQSRSGGKTP